MAGLLNGAGTDKEQLSPNNPPSRSVCQGQTVIPKLLDVAWVQDLSRQDGNELIMSHDSDGLFFREDELWAELYKKGFYDDLVFLFNKQARKIIFVIQLGKKLAGFPGIVHGGMISTIFDEAFGILYLALARRKLLPFRGHAFTTELNVRFKKGLPVGEAVVCNVEVDNISGPLLKMKGVMSIGSSSKAVALSQAVFYSPKDASKL